MSNKDMAICRKCGNSFDTSDAAGLVKLALNRGDGVGPLYYCCVTEDEALAIFADFEAHVIRGENETEQ